MSQTDRLNPEIVARLFADHADELTRFLTGVLGDVQLATDAVQVSFAKLLEQGGRTRAGARKSWLFRVAYNEAMAVRRREAIGDRATEQLGWIQQDGPSAEEPLLREEAVRAVRTAIARLPAAQRKIVEMRIYEEKTFAQIAEELKIPLGTALSRMRAAMGKLKDWLPPT